jgi:hypothetical protein
MITFPVHHGIVIRSFNLEYRPTNICINSYWTFLLDLTVVNSDQRQYYDCATRNYR